MNKLAILLCVIVLINCHAKRKIIEVASFKGQQVTGVTVNTWGRIFANFPRWRKGVKNSVIEIYEDGLFSAFPDNCWNSWELGDAPIDSVFVAVQSVVAFEDKLYVLDTRNPVFHGVLDNPRIFVFDITSNRPIRTYIIADEGFHKDSYINDLRIDKKNNKIYLTDSGHAGLVILDLTSGDTKRVLDNHISTRAETNHLTFGNGIWKNTVHSDGIALDTKNDLLYFHALTGYNLYAVPTRVLMEGSEEEVQSKVRRVHTTPAPDGMVLDRHGNLYLADLENNQIIRLDVSSGEVEILAEGEKVKWADTFSIYGDELYYTNSRINEITEDIDDLIFTINKIKIN